MNKCKIDILIINSLFGSQKNKKTRVGYYTGPGIYKQGLLSPKKWL